VVPAAIAVFTDDDAHFHPKGIVLGCLDTRHEYQFRTYKLKDHAPKEYDGVRNPFAVAMKIALAHLQRNKMTDQMLLETKVQLARELFEVGYEKKVIRLLMDMIKYYTNFENPAFVDKFDTELQTITQNPDLMGLEQRILADAERQGLEKGLLTGMEKGIEKGIEKEKNETIQALILKTDFTDSMIAVISRVEEWKVAEIRVALMNE
jgi:hypothetical protein